MISRTMICLYRLRHTAVTATVPSMISRGTIYLCRLRHAAVAAAAPAMISRGTIYLCRLRHTAVAAAAPAMISRVFRRSTVVVIAIVRNRSCDATAAATVQHCRRSSSQPHAPSLALSEARGTALSEARGTTAATVQLRRNISTTVATTAMVPMRVRSSSTDAAPMVARGTVRHIRSSSQAPAPSLASAGSRGALAAMDRR